MFDLELFIANLQAKGFRNKELILYLISEGIEKQDIIDICLEAH